MTLRRGEIVRLLPPRATSGREQRGARYGVIVQSGDLLALSTVIVAPTSTGAQPASFRPEITMGRTRTRVLVDQLTAVDRSRLGRSAGTLTWQELGDVDEAIQSVLGLTSR